ncbi:MAG: glycerol-3-phosphate 1-O-acyltransferase PlsY [Pseudomonadota bacterium]
MGIERALPWLPGALACGYLAGSIPMGLAVARLFSLPDPRNIGSGNIGATNVLRTGNKAAAAITLLLDASKGLLAVLFFLGWGDLAAQAAGLGALIGHCFPIWLGFRGGKGVATFLGVLLGLFWPAGLLACLTWLIVAGIFRISSVAALASSLSAPIWLAILDRWEAVLVMILIALLVWVRHAANIRRVIAGDEPRIGKSS